MFNLDKLACDPESIEEGSWVEVYKGWPWLMRNLRSRAYQRWLKKHEPSADWSDSEHRAHIADALAEVLVLDWKPATFGGQELTFSPEALRKIVADPRYPDLLMIAFNAAGRLDNFRAKEVEEGKGD